MGKTRKNEVMLFLVMTLCLYFLCSGARASISVYPIETSTRQNGVSQIQVLSRGDQISFVKVTEKWIIQPGTPEEKEVEGNMANKGALIITPQKIAVTPGGQRTVRLVTVTPPEKETTWRVYFEEVSAGEFNDATDRPSTSKTSAEVGVNFVWGALVHVAPRNPSVSMKIDSKTGKLVNDGTLRIPLTEIGVCSLSGECRWYKEDATIYPDTQVNIKSLRYQTGEIYKARLKNWLSGENEEISLPVISGNE